MKFGWSVKKLIVQSLNFLFNPCFLLLKKDFKCAHIWFWCILGKNSSKQNQHKSFQFERENCIKADIKGRKQRKCNVQIYSFFMARTLNRFLMHCISFSIHWLFDWHKFLMIIPIISLTYINNILIIFRLISHICHVRKCSHQMSW
jgi:hypothetical protein